MKCSRHHMLMLYLVPNMSWNFDELYVDVRTRGVETQLPLQVHPVGRHAELVRLDVFAVRNSVNFSTKEKVAKLHDVFHFRKLKIKNDTKQSQSQLTRIF
jgi:hypothetical protein